MQHNGLHGIVPPVITVINSSGALDRPGMGRMIDHLIASGVHGLFFLGSAGECFHLSKELRQEVAEFAVSHVNGRLPVLIGIGSTSTAEAVDYGKHAEAIGADGVVVINPYFAKLSDELLFRHYADIAEAVSVPIYIYNFPALTGQDVKVDLVKDLALTYPNIVGIKETVDRVEPILEAIAKVKSVRPDFQVFAGYDHHLLETLIAGGDGVVPASANFAPHLTCGLYDAYRRSDFAMVQDLQRKLFRVVTEVYAVDTPFFNVLKEAVRATGVDIPADVLPPARSLSQEKKVELERLLKKYDLIRIIQHA
ncbi:dihydrodipicolinate synthase family protein [Paenibacillus apiarius]|uniref:dihydrodipicolinate synthase family protein n=1 Tax=Paenibacillus apiarius TaxID=46240 RepID=UPI003B3B2030